MAISFNNGSAASSATAVASLALPSFNLTAGQDVFVGIVLGSTASSISSITDTHGNTYSLVGSINGTGVRAEFWKSISVGAQTANIITVNIGGGSTSISASAGQYAGVSALGSAVTNSGNGNSVSLGIATTQTNNWIIGILGFATASATTQTASSGNSREASIAASSVGGALYDNTAVPSATLLLQTQLNALQNFACVGIELQTGSSATSFTDYAASVAPDIQDVLLIANSTAYFVEKSFTFPLFTQHPPAFFAPVPVGVILQSATTGSAYSETITTNGGVSPYTYALQSGSLPTGTALNTSTGVISGTPSVAGTFSFIIQSTDSNGNIGSQNFQIIVSAPAAQQTASVYIAS